MRECCTEEQANEEMPAAANTIDDTWVDVAHYPRTFRRTPLPPATTLNVKLTDPSPNPDLDPNHNPMLMSLATQYVVLAMGGQEGNHRGVQKHVHSSESGDSFSQKLKALNPREKKTNYLYLWTVYDML